MEVHQLGRGLVADAFAAATDMDLGPKLEKTRGHGFAKTGSASGHENASPGKKLIPEHRFHLKAQMNARLTKSGSHRSVKQHEAYRRREILMEQRVSISISEGIADVRLARADKMNALDAEMFEAPSGSIRRRACGR
jgi:hypothetical protein